MAAASRNRFAFPDEHLAEPHALMDSLSPVLRVMLFCRTYFRQLNVCQCFDTAQDSQTHNSSSKRQKSCTFNPKTLLYGGKASASFALTISWVNAIRMFAVFTADDKTFDQQLVNKIVAVSLMLQQAIFHTSYYIASATGQLERFLHQIPVETRLVQRIRKFTTAMVVVEIVVNIISWGFFSYAGYYTEGKFDFLLAPLVTHIPIEGTWLLVARTIYIVIACYCTLNWSMTLVFNQVISLVLFHCFRELASRYRKAVDRQGRLRCSLKAFRIRHEVLAQAVKTADSFVMFSNVGGFCCQLISVILLLYSFFVLGYPDGVVAGIYTVLFVANVGGLVLCTIDGVLINNEVIMLRSLTGILLRQNAEWRFCVMLSPPSAGVIRRRPLQSKRLVYINNGLTGTPIPTYSTDIPDTTSEVSFEWPNQLAGFLLNI